MHDGGEGVIGRGGHVDVVVGVDRLLAAHCAAEDLDGTVGDDLVGVHIGLGAGARLPDDEGEVIDELKGSHLLSSLLDGLSELGVCSALASQRQVSSRCRTQAVLGVDDGGSALENAKGAHNGRRHAVLGLVDLEVLQRALCLGAPVLVRGHLDLAKGIALGPGVGHGAGDGELAALEVAWGPQRRVGGRSAGNGGERARTAGSQEGGVCPRMCQ